MKNRSKAPRTLYVTNRKDWRAWLGKNQGKENEIWLVYYKKHTEKPTIPYDDAVEEALCFGWIDSIIRRVDDEKYMRKFTPRKDRSIWSELNKKRVQKMIKQGLMTEAGSTKIREARRNGYWDRLSPVIDIQRAPADFKSALSSNKKASEYYQSLAPSYKKQYIGWIVSAKREETRKRRVKEAIKFLARNKKLGMQ
ncbi:MAG: YdeI/OmpD-associated family protein [Candidatus Neomarinimicrobiota bacterium]